MGEYLVAKDAIAFLDEQIKRLEWKTRRIIEKHLKKCRTVLKNMVQRNLRKRSGALAASVGSATTKMTTSNDMITGELQLNPSPGNPRNTKAIVYAETHFGTGFKVIHSKGKRLSIPIPKGPAWAGVNVFYQPSTYPGIVVPMTGTSVLFAVKGVHTKMAKLGKGQYSTDIEPAWVLRNTVKVPRRVNPQDAVEQIKTGLLYDLSKIIGSDMSV